MKKKIFREDLKLFFVSADLIYKGSAFQSFAAATEKDLSP